MSPRHTVARRPASSASSIPGSGMLTPSMSASRWFRLLDRATRRESSGFGSDSWSPLGLPRRDQAVGHECPDGWAPGMWPCRAQCVEISHHTDLPVAVGRTPHRSVSEATICNPRPCSALRLARRMRGTTSVPS